MPKGERNAEKTHCSKGHPYDEANTRWYTAKDGFTRRQCVTCARDHAAVSNAKKPRKTERRHTWTIEDRFWSYVDKNGPVPEHRPDLGPCWIWTGGKTLGYGVLGRGKRGSGQVKAHRFSYELHKGPIPEGKEPDHLCRVEACCHPDHLEAVTHRENCLRGTSPAARAAKATQCPQGHPYDLVNTYLTPQGHRQCVACRKVQSANQTAKRRLQKVS